MKIVAAIDRYYGLDSGCVWRRDPDPKAWPRRPAARPHPRPGARPHAVRAGSCKFAAQAVEIARALSTCTGVSTAARRRSQPGRRLIRGDLVSSLETAGRDPRPSACSAFKSPGVFAHPLPNSPSKDGPLRTPYGVVGPGWGVARTDEIIWNASLALVPQNGATPLLDPPPQGGGE